MKTFKDEAKYLKNAGHYIGDLQKLHNAEVKILNKKIETLRDNIDFFLRRLEIK